MADGANVSKRYLVIAPALDGYGSIEAPEIEAMTERHHFRLPTVTFCAGDVTRLARDADGFNGAILLLEHGLPSRAHLRLVSTLQSRGLSTLLAWPHEEAVEVVDRERLSSLRRHWIAAILGQWLKDRRANRRVAASDPPAAATGEPAVAVDTRAMSALTDLVRREAESLHGHIAGGVAALRSSATPEADVLAEHFASGLTVLERVRTQTLQLDEQIAGLRSVAATSPLIRGASATGPYDESALPKVRAFLRPLLETPRPVSFAPGTIPEPGRPLGGTGVYLRLDFWAPLKSGGSYGHTCYQARALARTCRDFVCIMANRFELLDRFGIRQVEVSGRDGTQTEANLLGMNAHYLERLGPLFDALRPAFIFERIVLGNAVGAWASRQFGIPYIAEYNGSEISIKRSFEGKGYAHEDLLLAAEDAAFRQATLISVVSEHVANDVARRGIPRDRILVNPNAVDLEAYAPAAEEEKSRLRAALGFEPHHRVIGFIGTFGGWHGIEVLAEALPAIVMRDQRVRVLLIGDGHLKHLVRDAVAAAGIRDRVVDVGRVPQEKGAELLKVCDVLVSPHSRNMIDSPFFGSPTKLFEYMAMGAGIVASNLEQIGHVLSPALTHAEIAEARAAGRLIDVGARRAVLCKPGDVAEFTEAVLALADDPILCAALGRNARAAAARYYTWDQHVANLWQALAGQPAGGYAADREGKR